MKSKSKSAPTKGSVPPAEILGRTSDGRPITELLTGSKKVIQVRLVPILGGFTPDQPNVVPRVTLPAPAGYSDVIATLSGLSISRASGQNGAPGVHGVHAQVRVESATPTSVVLAGTAHLDGLDRDQRQGSIVHAVVTFYAPL